MCFNTCNINVQQATLTHLFRSLCLSLHGATMWKLYNPTLCFLETAFKPLCLPYMVIPIAIVNLALSSESRFRRWMNTGLGADHRVTLTWQMPSLSTLGDCMAHFQTCKYRRVLLRCLC